MMVALFLLITVVFCLLALDVYTRFRRGAEIRLARSARTPWEEVPAPPGERRWRCRMPLVNRDRRDQALLLELQPQVQWLLAKGRAPFALAGHTTMVADRDGARRDGYFATITTDPGEIVWFTVEVTARGAQEDLHSLAGGLLSVRYRVYTRHSDTWHQADVVIPAGAPAGMPAVAVRDGVAMQPVPTHLLTEQDDLADVIRRYAAPAARPGDLVVVAETALAIMQGRYFSPAEVKPGWVARCLCTFFPMVGSLSTQYTFQALINEHGALRVGGAALAGFAAKVFRVRGVFFRLAGEQARLMDDLNGTMPPFDKFIVLGPANPAAAVADAAARTGLQVAIVDANDAREAFVLAASPGVDVARLTQLMRTNPQGNDCQQTPLVVVRAAAAADAGERIA